MRARFYNPVVGRFTQEDVYRGDGLNLYAYCGNNPVVYYDPSGYKKRVCPDSKTRAINDNKDVAGVTPKTYTVNGTVLSKKEFAALRRKAVRQSWRDEKELVKMTGKGTKNWTLDEMHELLSTGKVKGYEGQHMKSAAAHPNYAGNADNIQFLKGRNMDINEHLDAHGGNYKNPTNGYYDPISGVTVDFGDYVPGK